MRRPEPTLLSRACRLAWRAPAVGLACLASTAVQAQDAAGRTFTVVPTFTVQQTFTDNIDLVSTGERSESITELSPGVRVSSRSGRVQGNVDYSLSALVHARNADLNTWRNLLGANLTAELIERRAFLDASASISQQTISAFGTQTGSSGLVSDNRTEVSTFSLRPSLRGNLGGWADLQASASWTTTRAASTDLGDGSALGAALNLSGRQGVFGWGLNSSWQRDDFTSGDQSTSDAVFATGSFYPEPELQLSLRGGVEGEDALTGRRTTTEFWGWGASWRPGERTTVSVQSDRRYFGNSHSFSFSHRMARSIWTYSDSRGLNDPTGGGDLLNPNQSRALTIYELYFAQFASLQPDPVKRDLLVRSFLQATGQDPKALVGGGFLGSGKTTRHSQNLSVALTGIRNTVTLSGFRTETLPLGADVAGGGDLAKVGRVRQSGFSLGASHRLTPTASLNLAGSRVRTFDEPGQPGIDLRTLSLLWSSQISLRANASVALRHTQSESVTSPYTESAVVGSISLQF